jgi:hypothetical protein
VDAERVGLAVADHQLQGSALPEPGLRLLHHAATEPAPAVPRFTAR